MKVFKVEMKFMSDSEGYACDLMSVLLSEEGRQENRLLDWSYDNCGGEWIKPSDNGNGRYTATVWILPQPSFVMNLEVWLLLAPDMLSVKIVEEKEIAVSVTGYDEGDFLAEVFPETKYVCPLCSHIPLTFERDGVLCLTYHDTPLGVACQGGGKPVGVVK